MHPVFKDVDPELRRKAYELFQSLPVDESSEAAWRTVDLPMERGAALCPIGAIAYVYHGGVIEGSTALDVGGQDLFVGTGISPNPDTRQDFRKKYDAGHFPGSDLADAMGVPITD